MKDKEDPRAWLRREKQLAASSKGQHVASSTAMHSNPKHVTHGMQDMNLLLLGSLLLLRQLSQQKHGTDTAHSALGWMQA